MSSWFKKHPQRACSFLLIIFTQIQGSLALANFTMPPLATWGINTVFGIVMAALAFAVKNLDDEGNAPPSV